MKASGRPTNSCASAGADTLAARETGTGAVGGLLHRSRALSR